MIKKYLQNQWVKNIFTLVLLSFFIVSASALAVWTPPEDPAPTCNTGDPGCDAPINVSAIDQTKIGDFTSLGSLVSNNLFVAGTSLLATDSGANIGIGTASPTRKLHVEGNVLVGGVPEGNTANALSVYANSSFRTQLVLENTKQDPNVGSRSASILMSSPAVGLADLEKRWWSIGTDWFAEGGTSGTGNNFWIWNGRNDTISWTRMFINSVGNVGFGPNNTTPRSTVDVKGGDVFVNDSTRGVILRSTSSASVCYRISVSGNGPINTAGTLSAIAVSCP